MCFPGTLTLGGLQVIVNRWLGEDVEMIPGIVQGYEHPDDWPYEQDWIVESVHLDTSNRVYWINGHHENGKKFFWGHYVDQPLDWRYDLTNATYQIGRHETKVESRKRVDDERSRLRLRIAREFAA